MVTFAELRQKYIEPARATPPARRSLTPPASALFELYEQQRRIAVTGVVIRTNGDLHDVYSYIVEPAFRRDCDLWLHSPMDLEDLDPADFVDQPQGYPWTLERLQWLAYRYQVTDDGGGLPPMTPIERSLWNAFRTSGMEAKPQFGVGPYRVDFGFPAYRLAVECDGRDWHDAERDRARDAHVKQLGWTVLHFTGSRLYRDADSVAAEVRAVLASRPRVQENSDLEEAQLRTRWWRRLFDWILGRSRRDTMRSERGEAPDSNDADAIDGTPDWLASLDSRQREAVLAHDGVTQVIAPAGSGKTLVLINRVRELMARGVPPERILCLTFNTAAKDELQSRLASAGVDGPNVRTFHGVGYLILREEGLDRNVAPQMNLNQWRRVIKLAKDALGDSGEWIEPDEMRALISDFKLADMLSPQEARERAASSGATARELTAADVYGLYQQELDDKSLIDFDDQILLPVKMIREDPELRARWQQRWEYLLVDEYQDIEPAQELLIQALASPEDHLFCVGDEDQTLYAWRRASVETMLEFDKAFPGLQRHPLEKCYRCPSEVLESASQLIGHNRQRFPKRIVSGRATPESDGTSVRSRNGAGNASVISVQAVDSLENASGAIAAALRGRRRDEVVVLARTVAHLRPVAVACARSGVSFDGPEQLLGISGAHRTLSAYLSVLGAPQTASAEDVNDMFRIPNRYLPNEAERMVAERLRAGQSFAEAVGDVEGEEWRMRALNEGARLFDAIAGPDADAAATITRLRGEGKLDSHYAAQEKLSPAEQAEIDTLASAQKQAQGKTVRIFAEEWAQEDSALKEAYAPDRGIELTTVHRSKGREWPDVWLLGADEDQLPHYKATHPDNPSTGAAPTQVDDSEKEREIEAERRIAYVAFTRARERLHIVHTAGKASRFLSEAGLEAAKDAGPATAPPDTQATGQSPVPKPPRPHADALTKTLPISRPTPVSGQPTSLRVRPKQVSGTRQAWSESEDRQLKALQQSGKTVADIARILRRSSAEVTRRLQALNFLPKKRR